ncbi:hypothetical protein B0H12DRAFT_54442 [Mycena haematopus]|nr:hypothetical protein B0H12DRAFT_54442 [Mycena haematopus]
MDGTEEQPLRLSLWRVCTAAPTPTYTNLASSALSLRWCHNCRTPVSRLVAAVIPRLRAAILRSHLRIANKNEKKNTPCRESNAEKARNDSRAAVAHYDGKQVRVSAHRDRRMGLWRRRIEIGMRELKRSHLGARDGWRPSDEASGHLFPWFAPQKAGRQSVREFVRGVFKHIGFAAICPH